MDTSNNLKKCIVICGGGGKSTLFEEQPNKYLDIDFYMWNNSNIRETLEKLLKEKDVEGIGNLYNYTFKNDKILRNEKKILLIHHPENAIVLNREILGIYRPSKKLHLKNIENRESFLKTLAINNWYSLDKYNCIEFSKYPIPFES